MAGILSNVLIESNRTLFPRLSIPLSFCVRRCGHFDTPTKAKVAETASRARVNIAGPPAKKWRDFGPFDSTGSFAFADPETFRLQDIFRMLLHRNSARPPEQHYVCIYKHTDP